MELVTEYIVWYICIVWFHRCKVTKNPGTCKAPGYIFSYFEYTYLL